MALIDERTRENPESALCHTELLDVQLREAYKARSAAWSWPRSGEAHANPHDFMQQHFDTEAHKRFMRSLG